MSQDIRRELISKNLGIKPISHGQVYAFQIVIPESRKQPISLEQRQAIEKSLLTHQTNLISLIIRRTDAYDDEDIEYEIVHGAGWLKIAQELDIEKVWAWVFDMTDEQALDAIAEMESLTETSRDTQASTKNSDGIDFDIATLIDKKLQLSADSIKNLITSLLTGIRNDLDEKLKVLNYRIDHLSSANDGLGELETVLGRLDTIQQQLTSSRKVSGITPLENQINLLDASDQDIEIALMQVATQGKHIVAAIKAVRYWKQSEQGLTWKNLEISVKAKTGTQHKIEAFAKRTYDRLYAVAFIPEQ
jgi:hypothetical protein